MWQWCIAASAAVTVTVVQDCVCWKHTQHQLLLLTSRRGAVEVAGPLGTFKGFLGWVQLARLPACPSGFSCSRLSSAYKTWKRVRTCAYGDTYKHWLTTINSQRKHMGMQLESRAYLVSEPPRGKHQTQDWPFNTARHAARVKQQVGSHR